MNKRLSVLAAAFAALAVTVALCGCSKSSTASVAEEARQKALASRYIDAVTPHLIGRLTPVSIRFRQEAKLPLAEGVSLSPRVQGSWQFDENQATFTPEKPWKAGSSLTLSVDCARLFGEETEKSAGAGSGVFKQQFSVAIPSCAVQFDEVRFNESTQSYTVSGAVVTDIPSSEKEVSALLSARYGLSKTGLTWQQAPAGNTWYFTVDGIQSAGHDKQLSFGWKDKRGAEKKCFTIPARSAFSILDINTSKPNTLLVSFSKPLDAAQDIASFVRAYSENGALIKNLSANVRGNVLSIFSDSNFENVRTVSLGAGIRSSGGILLAAGSDVQLSEHWELPSVRFMNDNVILPTTQGAVFPIETRNLTGVLVQVYAVYERTMAHFLQENELNESDYLYRVGEPVWEKKVAFDWNASMQNKYIPRGLDMTELIKKYPDGMFHIRVSFRHDQIKYVCRDRHADFSSLPMPPDTIEPYEVPAVREKSSWDYWENKNTSRDGWWRYDDDPCHPAFYTPRYNSSVLKSRNVLISDLGIMAKRDTSGSLFVTVADLKTGKPVSGAQVDLRSYVGTPITSAKTDASGNALFTDADKTYVVTAHQGKQTSYLKIASATALSTSHFEIGGEKAEGGVKGAIYGERGVWRPGDSLFLTFVLQDPQKTLPANIPVTFELLDPQGRVSDTQLLTRSLNGFYPVQTATKKDAVTGLWTARVTIGGKKWTKYVSVEAVVPNHLDVKLEADKEMLVSDENHFTLTGAWLHGAPTPYYNADVSVSFSPAATTFDGYSEYTFTSLNTEFEQRTERLWEGELSSDSKATFEAELDAGRRLPGKLNAHFSSRIFEPAGGFSTQSKTFVYSPYSRYVGIKLPKGDAARNMLLTDTDHTVDVALLTADGKPVKDARLSYHVYKIEWKWWWEKDAYTSATHVSSSYHSVVASGNVDVKDGRGAFKFQVKYPDWGRYYVEVSDSDSRDGSHIAGKIVYIDWPGWAGRAQEGGTGSAAMVPLTAGKTQYTSDETAEISFTSNEAATAYVTIEKAGRIIGQQKIDTQKGSNVYKLKLTEDMSPNIYVHLTLVQPHLQTANSLPIRLYGVIPVRVDNPRTKLTPVITTKESFEPNKTASFTVSETTGRAMTYTLAVVDEGLLGLTNYHAPDLRSEFYKKEASEIENWDIYRYVMNAYSGKLETILAIGGSDEAVDDRARNENRFAPVVRYFGPYKLAAGEKKTTEFEMPYYIGAVRAIVVAGQDGAFGKAEKTVPVKSALMVQATFPRTLGTNEQVDVPVTVFNGETTEKTVTVALSSRGIINGTKTQEVTVAASSSATVTFPVETKAAGHVFFEASAKTATATAKSNVSMDIVSRGVPVTNRTPFTLKPGESKTVTVPSAFERGSGNLLAELSPLPQIDLSSRVQYLIQYPHGCIEQITSGGFPQLFLPSFLKLGAAETNKIKDNVMSVFDRYPTYQTASGAMGYWPGNQEPHAWGTTYAVHFMTLAKQQGYAVPSSVYEPALSWLSDSASRWTEYNDDSAEVQAYRLFVLALAGKPDMGAMNRLESMKDNTLGAADQSLLGAAYALSGRKKDAKKLCVAPDSSRSWRSTGGSFGSNMRDLAVHMVACTYAEQTVQAAQAAKKIAERLSSNDWLSTQETAWALYAMLPFYSQQKLAGAVSYSISSGSAEKADTINANSATVALPFASRQTEQTATVTNTGSAVLYGTLAASGTTIAGSEKAENNGLKLSLAGLKDLRNASVGETVELVVTVENTSNSDVDNIALTVPIGTCLEFANDRLGVDSDNPRYAYQDIRDDAVYTYFKLYRYADWGEPKELTFKFYVTVSYSGSYYIPAIHAEAMYDNDIRATWPGTLAKAEVREISDK
ncbi:MAG: alpha-2-macroglobulin [Treponema sp.]|nr:alpha-2-macroglobulin [Treponema sp.]